MGLVFGGGGGFEVGCGGRQKTPSATPCWLWPDINHAKKAFSSTLVNPWRLKVMPWGKGGCLAGCAACAALAAWCNPAGQDLAGRMLILTGGFHGFSPFA